jgi:hypothetical protein
MSSISIIGLGSMARTLGARTLATGGTVEFIGRDAAKAGEVAATLGTGATAATLGSVPAGDIVILAVPYTAAAAIVSQYGDALAGKVIVDITNTFNPPGFTELVVPRDSSGTQEIAGVAPAGTPVVKAFNTVFGHVLAAHKVGDDPLDVFVAGDDADAKASVGAFVESLALRPLDVGDLSMAHWLEGVGLLMMRLLLGGAVPGNAFALAVAQTA